jgi:predicted DNA-binding transcriptional regulator AlpA
MTTPSLPEYMQLHEILKYLKISKSTWYAGIAKGLYPQPYKPSPRRSVWPREKIEPLIDAGRPKPKAGIINVQSREAVDRFIVSALQDDMKWTRLLNNFNHATNN